MKMSKLFITTIVAGLCYSVNATADDTTAENGTTVASNVTQTVAENYPVTLEFVDTKIQDVLNILAEQRPNTSILIGPEVQGNVTLNIKDVAWMQALELILDQHKLEYVKISENIFQIKTGTVEAVAEVSEIAVELYDMSEIVNMEGKELTKLYKKLPTAREDVTEEQMRTHIIENGKTFVKKIQANNQPAIKIIESLAKAADLNFSFAGIQRTASPQAGNPQQQVSSPYDNRVSLSLRRLPLEKVLTMVCSKGGLSCIYKDEVWEVSPRQAEQARPLVIGHFEVKFIPTDKVLLDVLRSLISVRGKITAGKNKTLIVKATEEELEAIRNTLAIMDKPTPQVMIEARFFELADGESSYVGIDWGGTLGKTGTKISGVATRNYTDTSWTPNNTGDIITEYDLVPGATDDEVAAWKADPANAGWSNQDIMDRFFMPVIELGGKYNPASPTYEGLNAISTAAFGISEFSAVVHALNEDAGSTQLANPKIIVTSGEQATIHIGEKLPIVKASSSGSGESAERTYELDSNYGKESSKIADLTGDGSAEQDVFNAQGTPGYLDLGTLLTVAPTVKTEDQVYIKVIPNLTKVTGTIAAGENTYPVLFSTKVYTEFTINSGQTVAIGGLVKEEELKQMNKIPLLGDIPLIGKYLFSYESDETKRSETVIFLTVNVVGAKDLKLTSGVPVNSKLVDPMLNLIREQDAQGAEYVPMKAPVVEEKVIETVTEEVVTETTAEEATTDDAAVEKVEEVAPEATAKEEATSETEEEVIVID